MILEDMGEIKNEIEKKVVKMKKKIKGSLKKVDEEGKNVQKI